MDFGEGRKRGLKPRYDLSESVRGRRGGVEALEAGADLAVRVVRCG